MIVDGLSAASWQTTSASQKKISLVRLVSQDYHNEMRGRDFLKRSEAEMVRNMSIPQI